MTLRRFYHRSELGLASPNPAKLAGRSGDDLAHSIGLTVHWTGFGGTLFHPDPLQRLRGIQAFHMHALGYGDVAYNAAFDADGNVYELRSNDYVSAHALSAGNIANRYTNGIVFLEDARRFTHAAGDALSWVADLFRFTHGRNPVVMTHHWWKVRGGIDTECPGPYLSDVVGFVGGLR